MANKLDGVRTNVLESISSYLTEQGNEILRTGSQEIALPIVSDDHEDEGWLVITFKIPKGSRDGEAYDGYGMAEDYKMKQDSKAKKAQEAAAKKAAKIEKDKKAREERAKARAERAEKAEQ